jgi:hypothetical protein
MYKYKGYVVLRDTGAAMTFEFDYNDWSMTPGKFAEMVSYSLKTRITNIKYIEEYKVKKNK